MSVIVNEVKVKAVPKKTIVYNKFRGVDFSTDPALVDRVRSPYALNLISDTAGMPEKRVGWRCLHSPTNPGDTPRIKGLWAGELNGFLHMLAVADEHLVYWGDDFIQELGYYGVGAADGVGFFMKMDGINYFFYLNEDAYTMWDDYLLIYPTSVMNHYSPVIIISKNPDGTGGDVYDPVNLISSKRTESFLGNNSDLDYYLSAQNLYAIDKVEVMNAQGVFVTVTTGFTKDTVNGKVAFTAPQNPVIAGQDNVRITYRKTENATGIDLKKCTVMTKYGYGGENRVFLSGHPDYPNHVWYSEVNRPDYFPDTNYITVGDGISSIMGFLKLGKYLLIVKDGRGGEASIWQCWGEMDSDGKVTFKLEQGTSGIGAIAKKSFETLIDEPLFLTSRGLYAVTDTNILAERTLKNRSYYVDNWLLKEKDLQNAIACEWNGYYILCINARCYVFDSRSYGYRPNQTNHSGDFVYDAYYWDNIPATCFLPMDEELYFGTEDGRICKFNTDKPHMDKYNDNGFLLDPDDGSDGVAVNAVWMTKNDDDGASYLYKSMQKKGCSITIKPFYRSSAKVYVIKDGQGEKFIREGTMDIFDSFDNIDFERFTFNTNTNPQDIYLKKKVKKYKRLQIIVRNEEKGEGFGIFQITKTFTVGNFAKK